VGKLTKKASAVIRLKFPSEEETRMIQIALKPETETSPTRRSKVHAKREGRDLTLIFESKDTSALRASVNSYLSWLLLLNDIYKTLGFGPKEKANRTDTSIS